MKIDYNEVKKDLESAMQVLSEIFNPKQNAVTNYILPILEKTLVFIDEQQEKNAE
jgi:hypothetical protein